MAIAEMSRMTLVALLSDKEKVYDALQKTGAAQIKTQTEKEYATPYPADLSPNFTEKIERANKCLEFLADETESLDKTERGEGIAKDGFEVTLDEFFAAGRNADKTEEFLGEVEKLSERKAELKAERAKTVERRKSYEPYEGLNVKFSVYKSTKKTSVFLGIIPSDKIDNLKKSLDELGTVEYSAEADSGAGEIYAVVAYKGVAEETEKILAENGFTKCPFDRGETAKEVINGLDLKIGEIDGELKTVAISAAEKCQRSKEVKVYVDYLAYLNEKSQADGTLLKTNSTFIMEAYVPTESEGKVREAVTNVVRACEIGFDTIPRDEFAPTLMKNGGAVSNFEAVTNMYSVPAYGALDPNAVMSFFFSLFMGLIMADFGYGILMILGGFLIASKQRDGTSLKRMAKVFAYGGFFALLFGALFDSWFGYPILRTAFGEGSAYNNFYAEHLDAISSPTSIMGVSVPKILMWCLGLGTIQIAVSLIMKAVQCFGRKQYLEGIFSGLVWAVGLLAFVVAVFGMASNKEFLTKYGSYIAIGFIVLGVLTAGISEKGVLAKFTKPFSSVYGLINYVSDILSYARLYGLMLSGAQIASIFTNNLAIDLLFPNGIVGIIFGVIVIIAGNLFNLAMSLLGAFIHDSRLQYVEFFGRFYEGEGELFTPLGRSGEHVYIKA